MGLAMGLKITRGVFLMSDATKPLTPKEVLYQLCRKTDAVLDYETIEIGAGNFASFVTVEYDGREYEGERADGRGKKGAEQNAAQAFLNQYEAEIVWLHAMLNVKVMHRDYVTALQDLVRASVLYGVKPVLPQYHKAEGPNFTISCSVRLNGKNYLEKGSGSSPNEARRQAAGAVMVKADVIPEVLPITKRQAKPVPAATPKPRDTRLWGHEQTDNSYRHARYRQGSGCDEAAAT